MSKHANRRGGGYERREKNKENGKFEIHPSDKTAMQSNGNENERAKQHSWRREPPLPRLDTREVVEAHTRRNHTKTKRTKRTKKTKQNKTKNETRKKTNDAGQIKKERETKNKTTKDEENTNRTKPNQTEPNRTEQN